MIEWEDDDMITWERMENLLSVKDIIRAFDEKFAGEHGEDQARLRLEKMRKRAKKAQ